MEALAQEIIRSYEERAAGEARRQREARQETAQRRTDVTAQLEDYGKAHTAMSRELRADLSQTEAQRQRQARQETAQRRTDVTAQLTGYDEAHAAMSRELRDDLSQVAPPLGRAEAERQAEARQETAQRRTDVAAQLTGYDEAHAAMSRDLQADLSQTEAQRQRQARQEITGRRTDVTAQLTGYRDEQTGARAAWQEMAVTLQTKRGVAVPVAKPHALPVKEAAAAPSAEVEAAAATAPLKIEEVAKPPASLRDRVFSHLADRPDGVRLVDIEGEFGVGRFEAIRLLKDLMDEGNAEKRDLLYFAI